jgi:hypothetical protein
LRLGYVKLELEEEEMEKVEVEITVEKMVRKERYNKTFVEIPNRLQFLLGGVHIIEGDYSDDPPGNLRKWKWVAPKPVLITATVGDSVNVKTTENYSPWAGVGYSHTSFFLGSTGPARGVVEAINLKYINLFGEGKKKLQETFTLYIKVLIK